MFVQPKICPNSSCSNHTTPIKNWFKKIGYYKPKQNHQPIPRYKCKTCGKSFSTSTTKATYKQHKPDVNEELFKLLVSGVSLRRCSEILDIQYSTVVEKFAYLAKQAKKAHYKHMLTLQTSYVQVDELETFLHARAKALSVPMVVRVKTGEILNFAVAKMPAKGKLATIGQTIYNWTVDERSVKFQFMLVQLQNCFKPNITFKCDSNSSYKKWIANQITNATINQIVAGKKKPKGSYDDLFAINNTFARMRHDMNRLARKTWSTTKAIHGLENHIWLYIAWNNDYKIK